MLAALNIVYALSIKGKAYMKTTLKGTSIHLWKYLEGEKKVYDNSPYDSPTLEFALYEFYKHNGCDLEGIEAVQDTLE